MYTVQITNRQTGQSYCDPGCMNHATAERAAQSFNNIGYTYWRAVVVEVR